MWLYFILLVLTPFWNYPRLPKIGSDFTVIKAVGLITLGASMVAAVARQRYLGLLRWTEVRLYLSLFAVALLSALVSGAGGQISVSAIQIYLSVLVYFIASLVYLDSIALLRQACYVLLFSMLLASYSVFSGYGRYGGRPGGIFGDPNYYALVATSVLPLVLQLFPEAWLFQKAFLALCGLMLVGGTLMSGSRGGIICLAIVALYSLLYARRRALFLACCVPILLVLAALLPQTAFERFRNADSGTQISTEIRRQTLRAGLAMIRSKPLLGVGLGMFKSVSPDYNPELEDRAVIGHNTYLEIAAELGVPACLLFMALLFASWARARRLGRELSDAGHSSAAAIARALEIGLAVFSAGAAFLSAEYTKQLWILMSFGVALGRIREDEEDEELGADHPQNEETLEPAPAGV